MIDPARVYGVPELWRETRAPRAMLYAALESGDLRGIRRGRRWIVPGTAVLTWLEGLREEAPR